MSPHTIDHARLGDAERRALANARPHDAPELLGWIRAVLRTDVPVRAIDPHGTAPFDYLRHAFFENAQPPRDRVVWACRGGGKTFYAALATTLDLLFKPGVDVLILAGSLEQASRMHEHLRGFFAASTLAHLLDGKPTSRSLRTTNGSRARIVAASQTAVRGARPQILRCDEADLIDPDEGGLWRAAQLATRSKRCGDTVVRGCVEALSTYHRAHGLMSRIVPDAHADPPTRTLFRWGLLDVLERCPAERPCPACTLEPDCAGRAKRGAGHISIDDAVTLRARSADADWRAEMLCRRPRRTDAVYPEFDRAVHVCQAEHAGADAPGTLHVAGMDFGFRDPTVVLFAVVEPPGPDAPPTLRILGEHVAREATLDAHLRAIDAAPGPRPHWIGVDPAGHQRSGQTGLSPATVLRRAGHAVRARRVPLADGLRAVRTRLAPATGSPTLFIHPRCETLIASLERYHFAPGAGDSPAKDGPDHACDALRYLVVNLDAATPARTWRYA